MVLSFYADAPLAQLAEQLTLNQWVPGSSPGGRTFTGFSFQRLRLRSNKESVRKIQ